MVNLRKQNSEVTCKKCLLSTKTYITCIDCKHNYHVECIIKVKGAFVSDSENIICCRSITSNCTNCKEKDKEIKQKQDKIEQKNIEIKELRARLFSLNEKILEESLIEQTAEKSQHTELDDSVTSVDEAHIEGKNEQKCLDHVTVKIDKIKELFVNELTEMKKTLRDIQTKVTINVNSNNKQRICKMNIDSVETPMKENTDTAITHNSNRESEIHKKSKKSVEIENRLVTQSVMNSNKHNEQNTKQTTTENAEIKQSTKLASSNQANKNDKISKMKIIGNSNENVAFTKT